MAEHHELVAEMSVLEQMGTQERQKLAKKRRLQQLKKWGQREKEWMQKEKQLNKRLANKLQEENNGLNLKNYTTYRTNNRPDNKKKFVQNGKTNNNNNLEYLNNNSDLLNNAPNRYKSKLNGLDSGLSPEGRVHFNVGVMLLDAAARSDYDEVKRLLMLGVSPDSINHDGLTALHQCCIDGSEDMMNLLLEFGANVDARDTEQWTPLHAACTCGHLNLVKILVENGADLLAVNGDGNMPFDICEDESTLDYIEAQMFKKGITQEMIDLKRASTEVQMISDLEKLVADGGDLNEANENGVTALHIAAANGYLSVVKFLLKHGVNVNVCDNDQWQPLHGAACWGNQQHVKVVELLVEAGASLSAKSMNDESVFDLCDNVELLEKLNQLKDELESKQASGSDRLRRTQSRTNSRVHSVRRTSVRDKNQISRREAREEALLRVDSSPVIKSAAQVEQTSDNSGSNLESSKSSENDSSFEMLKTADLDADQLVGSQRTNSNGSFKQTDLDEHKSTSDESHSSTESQNSTSRLQSVNASAQNESQDRLAKGSLEVADGNSVKHEKLKPLNEASNDERPSREAAHEDRLKRQMSSTQKQQQQQQVLLLAPINYTLSNLKKQRSDLRMRTTSIGNNNNNNNNSNDFTNQTDGQPISSSCELDRAESPSSSFRKFRGEPSELIGGHTKVGRHKCCCILI